MFNNTTSVLQPGDEVTVDRVAADGTRQQVFATIESAALPTTTADYYYGTTEDYYLVKDEAKNLRMEPRAMLHKREWVKVAFVGCTDDKRHDSYAVQKFMDDTIKQCYEQWPEESFTQVHIHSDNAGQHFKNSKSKRWLSLFLTTLPSIPQKFPKIIKATWSYGCPGHGVCVCANNRIHNDNNNKNNNNNDNNRDK